MIREKLEKIIVTGLVAGALISSSHYAFAAQKDITIPELGKGYTMISDTRSGNHSSVIAKCVAVYPTGTYDEDNFTKIRVRIFNSSGKEISDQKVLVEGSGNQPVSLYEDCMKYKSIQFGFCGNSANYKARARVGYDAQ